MSNGHGEPSVVTAGEISRNFGQWQDRALGGPVIVTHHGRPRVVLVSADYYSAFKGGASLHSSEDNAPSYETSQHAILDHVTEAFKAYCRPLLGSNMPTASRLSAPMVE